jgi:transcription termination/antitermination protein NusG
MRSALMAPSPSAHWYALAVHARQEKAAALEIEKRGVEVFLPVRVERRAWSDRIQNVEIALFPGYLFLKTAMTVERRVDLLKVHHVFDLVGRLLGDERIAREIPDHEIMSLKTLVTSPRNLDPVERLVPGKSVLVAAGPLKGAFGIVLEEPNGKRRLIVQIELLGRGVSAELSAEDLIEAPAGR